MNPSSLVDHGTNAVLARVQATYERVARNPYRQYHFHRGAYYARYYLGYPGAELAAVPQVALDRFAGVGNPLAAGELHAGETVLDLGCGAGTDLLIAARRVGATGRVIGVDSSPTMCRCAQIAARAAGLAERVEIREGRFEALPVEDESVDVIVANGALSLSHDKTEVLEEVRRVLRPAGRLYIADLVVVPDPVFDPAEVAGVWSACISGAMVEEEPLELAARVGLREGRLVGGYDCFRNAPGADRIAQGSKVHSVTLCAVK